MFLPKFSVRLIETFIPATKFYHHGGLSFPELRDAGLLVVPSERTLEMAQIWGDGQKMAVFPVKASGMYYETLKEEKWGKSSEEMKAYEEKFTP